MDIDISSMDLSFLHTKKLAVIDSEIENSMEKAITDAKEQGDSIGGIVETAIFNLPIGLGSPFFDSIESTISHLAFSIPGVKGIEFGDGFALAGMKGSEANDSFFIENNKIHTKTNHNGGILGGISTGMPIIFRVAFKPTSSIAMEQDTVNINTKENAKIKIEGRHDPCIAPRALPVVEAVAAMAILEHLQIKC
jgi:chorismate synthase